MRADTQNTYNDLANTKLAKHTKSTHTPHTTHGAWKEERCSRPLYSSHTTHPHNQPQAQSLTVTRAGQQDNHNHTTAWPYVCCPRHPTACQHTKTVRRISCTRSATQAHFVLRVCIHPEIFNTYLVAVTHSATSTTNTHNRGHKTNSSLERR